MAWGSLPRGYGRHNARNFVLPVERHAEASVEGGEGGRVSCPRRGTMIALFHGDELVLPGVLMW